MPQYYPIFMDLKDQSILVVGGGNVALRKVQTLLKHGAVVRVVSPEIVPELRSLINDTTCCWFEKEYSSEDIGEARLVFSCTENEEVNRQVSFDAKSQYRPVNVVDDPEKCSFIVPSIMEQGDLKIAVSTGGSSPIVARQIRAELEKLFGSEMKEYLRLLKTWRTIVKNDLSPEKRSVFWERITDGEVRKLIQENRLSEAEGVVKQCFQSLLA
ncbi:precorrin-2 dehydrogenase [Desulfosporosinus acidiphilus SJ4]|uniref:precorrin-2 dehydrogenase n=1 Tax=Desulfosporosinus acidiphilus (strain DSM 22704 / JCM 16185 / SJ4) TaxID=646529 RepID=I4D532_DESAJ|nr:bifunctional precorrin-2 dehydrogenase/sirohydrochlorin ferrochelatase [Desulfosporosinus acidiphilus]AFM40906.1 precorrin-2 dehydrogenase [Desulfosporosinus acidiphilus SJ4]